MTTKELINKLVEEIKDLKNQVKILEAKIDKYQVVVIKEAVNVQERYESVWKGPSDIYGNPIPYCSTSTDTHNTVASSEDIGNKNYFK